MTPTTGDASSRAAHVPPLPDQRHAAPPRRSEITVALEQVEGIERFNRARRRIEEAEAAAARSREMRMDSVRRLEVLQRQHAALVARAQEQLTSSGELLHATRPRTVLLAHRNTWFLDRVTTVLLDRGLAVVGRLENGADTVGLAVAEQPDLLLVEDTLAMVPGEEVVREVVRYCPSTQVVAQVAYADRVAALLDAGATAVVTRRNPPAEVAASLCALGSP